MDPNQQNRDGGSSEGLRSMRTKQIVNRIRSVVQGLGTSRVSIKGGDGDGEENQCGTKTKALIHNYSNFKRSGVPVRFMYYTNGTWVGFPKQVFELLKEGFLAQKIILEVSIDGSKFLFDFLRMLQVDLGNGSARSISWIDVEKNSFFPNSPVDWSARNEGLKRVQPKLVVEVRLDQNALKRKREGDEGESESGSSSDSDPIEESSCSVVQNVPKKVRVAAPPAPQRPVVPPSRNWTNVVMLKEDDQSYIDIKNIFLDGVKKVDPNIHVTSIRRCLHTSPMANARMQAFRKQIEVTKAARGGVANHKLAWHGASHEGVATILSHGFGMSGKVGGEAHPYGHGIYLSPARFPDTSTLVTESDHNGERHALLCRLIMGRPEKVNKGSDQFHPSSEHFDTGVDELVNPKLYIVWNTHMNRHILPEYVVSYKVIENVQEVTSRKTMVPQPNGPAPSIQFVKLIETLKSSIPSSRCQELEAAYKAHKEGKISKLMLIKLLRSIAGDTAILTIIQKFRLRDIGIHKT